MLTTIIALPLLGALVLAFVPRNYRFLARMLALAVTALTLAIAIILFLRFDTGSAGLQFEHKVPWVTSLGIQYFVAVDGLNVALILLAAIVSFAATCVSWEIKTNERDFYLLLLLMSGGVLGAFASFDMFFLFFFHELALVPTFLMIGLWGRGPDKNYATFKITLYLSAGALLALIGLIALYVQQPGTERTFDLVTLTEDFRRNPMSAESQRWIFPLLMFGFGILVSLFPFHTWAPIGYAAAPTATTMLHAGVLKKFGLYGLIRIALPIMPEGAKEWLGVLAVLCIGNILHSGWVAMRQRDFNLLLGNSSVAHMGFAFLGIASLSILGVTGAVVVMVAHGLLAALSFGISGYLYQHSGTLEMSAFSGLLKRLPFLGTVLIMAAFAGCGLPGFANFAGEVMVLFGSWNVLQPYVVAAAWGALLISAIYMLRAVRSIAHGSLSDKWTSIPDANAWRKVPFVILIAALLIFGLWPRLLTDKIAPSAETVFANIDRSPLVVASDRREPGR